MLNTINKIIRKVSIPLNILNILTGLLIGIAYVYLPFTSIAGLALGIIMALSSSATIGISYYFTAKHTALPPENQPKSVSTKASHLFLSFAIPMTLLNSASSFFGMFTGTLLLAGALAVPFAPPVIITFAVTVASILAISTFLNSWLQTHNIWESLKKKPPVTLNEMTHKNQSTQTEETNNENTLQLIQKEEPVPINLPEEREESTQEISQFPGTLFAINKESYKKLHSSNEEFTLRSNVASSFKK